MPASGPAALPPVYTALAAPGATLAGASHDVNLHEADRLELRALWTKLGLTPAAGNLCNWALVGDGTGKSIWVPTYALDGGALVNGSFELDQRIGPYTTTGSRNSPGAYTLDRWIVQSDGANVVDIAREPAGSANLNFGMRGGIKLTVVTANKKFGILQWVENAAIRSMLEAGVLSLQYKIRTVTANPISNARESIIDWYGTVDTAPPRVLVAGGAWGAAGTNPTLSGAGTTTFYGTTPTNRALTNSWQTFNVDNASAGGAPGNYGVFIWSDDTTTTVGDIIYISDVSLVPGPKALPILYRDPSLERLAARRYCYVSKADTANDVFATGQAFSGTQARCFFQLPVPLRAAPTLSVSAATDFQTTTNAFGVVAASALSLYNWHDDKATVTVTSGSLAGGDMTLLLAVNTSATITFDSELGT